MNKILLILFFLFTSLFASVHISDEKKIKNTLLKYNYGIIKMGKSGETQFFKSFVKQDVAVKLQVWFESWKFSNLTYIAQINDFRFSPVVYNENNATIKTMENWTFFYVNLATKKVALEPTQMFYEMEYTLKQHAGEWFIVAIKKLNERQFSKTKKYTPSLKPDMNKLNADTNKQNLQGKISTH